jgi:hypothetical protein
LGWYLIAYGSQKAKSTGSWWEDLREKLEIPMGDGKKPVSKTVVPQCNCGTNMGRFA